MIRDALRTAIFSLIMAVLGGCPAQAQQLHGCAIGISCTNIFAQHAVCPGQQIVCQLQAENLDDFGDPYGWTTATVRLHHPSGDETIQLISSSGFLTVGPADSATLAFVTVAREEDRRTTLTADGSIDLHDLLHPFIACNLNFPDAIEVQDCTPAVVPAVRAAPAAPACVQCDCHRKRSGRLVCHHCTA